MSKNYLMKEKDKNIALEAVIKDWNAFKHVDKKFRKDKSFVKEAATTRPEALQYADKSLKKDKTFILGLVKKNGSALEYADESLKKDRWGMIGDQFMDRAIGYIRIKLCMSGEPIENNSFLKTYPIR